METLYFPYFPFRELSPFPGKRDPDDSSLVIGRALLFLEKFRGAAEDVTLERIVGNEPSCVDHKESSALEIAVSENDLIPYCEFRR